MLFRCHSCYLLVLLSKEQERKNCYPHHQSFVVQEDYTGKLSTQKRINSLQYYYNVFWFFYWPTLFITQLLLHYQSLIPTILGSQHEFFLFFFIPIYPKAKSSDILHFFKSIHNPYYFHLYPLQTTSSLWWATNLSFVL